MYLVVVEKNNISVTKLSPGSLDFYISAKVFEISYRKMGIVMRLGGICVSDVGTFQMMELKQIVVIKAGFLKGFVHVATSL